jgi:MIP family channel proteins
MGVHGHQIIGNAGRAVIAEALGTFILVLAIGATAVSATDGSSSGDAAFRLDAIPLAGGFALVAIIVSIGHISGAHVNPAVTIGLAAIRRFPWKYVPGYVAAQLAGSCVAALLIWYVDGPSARSAGQLGATQPTSGVGVGRVIVTEAIVTFVLVLVVASVSSDSRVSRPGAAVAIGFALSIAVFIAGPITGAGVNPARALGPMLIAAQFTDWWAYVVGPILGGVAAAVLHDKLLRHGATGGDG